MNESNSDWLNDTLPDETTNINDNSSTKQDSIDNSESNHNVSENNVVANENITDTNTNQTNNIEKESINLENTDSKPTILNKTLNEAVGKIEEEELSDDEKYLNEFIGPNAEKFSYKILSFPGFLFTSLYMLYRKMYLLGFITLIIELALILFVNPYISIIINILTLLFFNSLYISHAKRKIEKIKLLSGSKESGYITNLCSEKGGVNKGIVLLAFILEIGIILASILFLPVSKDFETVKESINEYAEEVGIDLSSFQE